MKSTRKKMKVDKDARRDRWLLAILSILIVIGIVLAIPPSEKINQGLDIQGGLSVVLTAQSEDGAEITDEQMEKSKAIIETRVNALGANEATVAIQGNNQILVQIPGISDVEDALNTIGTTGVLEFAAVDKMTDSEVVTSLNNGTVGIELDKSVYTPVITGENIQNVSIGMESETSSYYAVNLRLDSEGTDAFAKMTTELYPTKGKIAIILDGVVQSCPAVQTAITGGEVSITGKYSLEDAKALQAVLESGSLPVSFTYEQSQVVGPTLGQGELMAGLIAAILGLILVMLYLIAFYRGLGILTAANMLLFALLYLGVLAFLSLLGLFSLSLAGIAGIILTIGMAADSSILIVERVKEEIKMGKSVQAAAKSGVRHAIITSIDADCVTLVSALCLFFIATASVKGFGLTLALGIICDIIVMLMFKGPIIRLLAPNVMPSAPGFWGIKKPLALAEKHREVKEDIRIPDSERKKEKDFPDDMNKKEGR